MSETYNPVPERNEKSYIFDSQPTTSLFVPCLFLPFTSFAKGQQKKVILATGPLPTKVVLALFQFSFAPPHGNHLQNHKEMSVSMQHESKSTREISFATQLFLLQKLTQIYESRLCRMTMEAHLVSKGQYKKRARRSAGYMYNARSPSCCNPFRARPFALGLRVRRKETKGEEDNRDKGGEVQPSPCLRFGQVEPSYATYHIPSWQRTVTQSEPILFFN